MGSTNKTTYFFRNKPVFGLDIGHGSLKVMQVDPASMRPGKTPRVVGYGTASFDGDAVVDGVITQPEVIAKSMQKLFQHDLIGDITTDRVAIAIPAYRTFGRSIQLPKLSSKELREAVYLEAEQYIPMPLSDLYLDYNLIRQNDDETELFAVAVPHNIVDSYITLARMVGLEPVLIDTTLGATARLFNQDKNRDVATVIVDFGSLSADISIFDEQITVTGTVQGGGLSFTHAIRDKLKVSQEEAGLIKTKYGIGYSKKQKEITDALDPILKQIVREIQRMIRYYEERYGTEHPIGQVVALGGGANMPGLTDYLTAALRLAVRTSSPWVYLNYDGLQPPSDADKPMYATVAGLSLTDPKEVFSR